MGEGRPRISVVVPTRDRPEPLRRCLAALEGQTVPVEIVVIEDTEARGPAWARNEGARRARGEVVCFTDDDCAPFPSWAKSLAVPILEGRAQATAGPTHMAAGATSADLAWEAIVTYLQEQAAKPGTSSPGFAATANLACSRALLGRLPFDESFPGAAGEDRDWAERAARQGAAPLLVPQALVLHRPGMRVRDFLRQQYRYGRGAARYRGAGRDRGFGSPSFYLGLLRAGHAAGVAPGALVCAAQAATLAGALAARGDEA
ncbi:MAG TPA: glycosyltransferase [Solirubrobacterales bacterium]|nr:glycosyltransferase [Solirubrobacterales bacterium]